MASIGQTIKKLHSFPRGSDNPESSEYRKAASYAWPGGYPIIYITTEGDVACPDCVNSEPQFHLYIGNTWLKGIDPGWCIEAVDVNWEDDSLICCHCNAEIESAYGDPDS